MIDTVILEIQRPGFTLDPKSEKKWQLVKGKGTFKVLAYEPNKTDIYLPRLSLIKRGNNHILRIEFSIPKLLYGNNVQEVTEQDFEAVIKKLRDTLKESFNIFIFSEIISTAKVKSFHVSKNIIFQTSYKSSYIIKQLQKVNFTKKMDKTKHSFRNDGESLQIYANNHSLVFYDKIKDLHKPPKRAIDSNQPQAQRDLFGVLRLKKGLEILRIEIRLVRKRKIIEIGNKISTPPPLTFEELFQNNVCQKIVSWYWENMILKNNSLVFLEKKSPQEVLTFIQVIYPDIKPKEAIYRMGLIIASQYENGIRGVRDILESYGSPRSWYRINDQIKEIGYDLIHSSHPPWLQQISTQIKEFQPLTEEVYKQAKGS